MLTEAERNELEAMRKHLAQAVIDDATDTTKDFWWQPAYVASLVELERKDAIESAASFLDNRAKEFDGCDNTTAAMLGRIYRDEAKAIRDIDSKQAVIDEWVLCEGSPGSWTAKCSRCGKQGKVCCDIGTGIEKITSKPEHLRPVCFACCAPNHPE